MCSWNNETKIQKVLRTVERNKEDKIKKKEQFFKEIDDKYPSRKKEDLDNDLRPKDVRVVIFASQSEFLNSVIEMFRKKTVVTCFDDQEKMFRFCQENAIKVCLLDMDPPSDIKRAIDLFSSLNKTIPDSNLFLCTSRPTSMEITSLISDGGIVIKKPVLKRDVDLFVRKYL